MFVWIGSIKILFIKLYAIEQIIVIVVLVVKINITVIGRKLNFVCNVNSKLTDELPMFVLITYRLHC